MSASELNTISQKIAKQGGDFIAEGGFTCVFAPPLTCSSQPDLPPGKYVSRIIKDSSEIKNQEAIKLILAKLEEKHPGKVAKYFNLMTFACDEFTIKPSDIHPNKKGEICTKFPKLQTPGEIKKGDGFYNLITPRQSKEFVVFPDKKNIKLTHSRMQSLKGLKSLLEALVYVRGKFIHNDTHWGNIGWMPDGHIVLFDWGSVTLKDIPTKFKNLITSYKKDYKEGLVDPSAFRTLAVINGTTNPERLRVVWDIISIMNVMKTLNIIPLKALNTASDKINSLLKEGIPSEDDLLKVIHELFQESLRGKTRKSRK